MIDNSDPIWGDVMDLAAIAARPVARRFHPYLEFEDLKQIGIEHALRRQDKVQEYLAREDPDERKQGERAFTTFLSRHMERKARAEKAKVCGYRPEDEYFYRPTMVEALIKVWSSGDYEQAGQVFDPADLGLKRRSKVASEGNDFLAMMADVDAALMRLDQRTRDMLEERFAAERTFAAIGETWDISAQRAEQIISRGVRRMVEHLGGRNPY
jgi:RNA polymerase sigma factor (sigma-70 family)